MISELYRKVLENELGRARYLLLLMIVGTLQILKQAKLEILAEALPIPILFESRRKKLKRFLKLEILNIEKIWFLCLKPTFRTPNCHRGKLRREKTKVSIKINIESEKRHLKNSKSLKMSSNLILNKEQ